MRCQCDASPGWAARLLRPSPRGSWEGRSRAYAKAVSHGLHQHQ